MGDHRKDQCENCGCVYSGCVCPQIIAYIPGVEEYAELLAAVVHEDEDEGND